MPKAPKAATPIGAAGKLRLPILSFASSHVPLQLQAILPIVLGGFVGQVQYGRVVLPFSSVNDQLFHKIGLKSSTGPFVGSASDMLSHGDESSGRSSYEALRPRRQVETF